MRCGFYEKDITPPLGTTIFGYFTKRVNEGVKSKLYAKAAVIDDGENTVAFLAIDSMCMPEGLPDFVRERVKKYTGIKEENILIAVTHSHTSGPCVKDLGQFKGVQILKEEPELSAELDEKTMEMTALGAADAVILAYHRLQEVNVKYGVKEVENLCRVRQYYIDDGSVRTNPGYCRERIVKPYSEPDSAMPVLFFSDKNDKPLGLITSLALHHDTVSGSEVCADYSGEVSKYMKKAFGEDFTSVFFSGFCGNINNADFSRPADVRPGDNWIIVGEIVAKALLEAIMKSEPVMGNDVAVKTAAVKIKKRELPDGFVEKTKEARRLAPKEGPMTIADPYGTRMMYASSTMVLSYYDEDKNKEFDVPVQVIKIGDCLIYAFPGEVFSQFGEMLKSASPTQKNMMVEMAHTDKHTGYIPIREMFDLPYVYEASYYSARLEKEAGHKLCDKAKELAKEIF